MIRTVLGDIPGSALKHAQCHEHLFVAKTPASITAPALRIDEPEKSVRELAAYKRAGGGAIVDAQPVFAGRMPRALRDASLCTGVHIVAVTGFHKRMFYDPDCPLFAMSAEALSALYQSEITVGMLDGDLFDRTDAKAGLVKIAFDAAERDGIRADWAAAAIEAARLTGAPILVHTEPDCDVLSLADRALCAGIPANKLIFCHMDRTIRDVNMHRAVAETGAYLCYDSVHRFKYVSAAEELALLTAMLEAGHGDRLLLSLDTTRDRLASYGGALGLTCILTAFMDEMRACGIPEASIQHMTRENAARALQMN